METYFLLAVTMALSVCMIHSSASEPVFSMLVMRAAQLMWQRTASTLLQPLQPWDLSSLISKMERLWPKSTSPISRRCNSSRCLFLSEKKKFSRFLTTKKFPPLECLTSSKFCARKKTNQQRWFYKSMARKIRLLTMQYGAHSIRRFTWLQQPAKFWSMTCKGTS